MEPETTVPPDNTAPPAAVVVDIQDVSKQFGAVDALCHINGQILAGQLTGLVGPDGAGKTTLMRMMAGLMTPTSGSIHLDGHDLSTARQQIAPLIGYMPQRFGLYEDLTVMENLKLYARLRAISAREHGQIFDKLLDFTRLGPFTGRLAGKLSGGMKQKLGLACALMGRPRVLLLDEPGVGVDPVSRQDLWRMVQALTNDGMAVVWSTAYLDEAERCKTVLLLNDGRLQYNGPPAGLTTTLKDRSFQLRDVKEDRRQLLSRALDLPGISDGVIQGDAVRLVLRKDATKDDITALAKEAGASIVAVPPRFEDAFVDLLGGGPGGTSAITAQMDPVTLENDITVSCRNLTRRFGKFIATDNVSFDVRRGEIFGLLGPNGAGKSTTFKMLCGLLKPSSGQARVVGYDMRTAPNAAKAHLGYMAQKFSLYGLLSVGQNLEFSAGVYGLEGAQKQQRIDEMISTFQLDKYLGASPDELPLGYKQRLALACALMHRPPIMFLDEPTSGVDPVTRREFWTHINGLVRKGVTVMVTTHFMDEAEYCDRVALMYQARMIALDTPDGLKRQAITPQNSNPGMEDAFITLINQANISDHDPATGKGRGAR